LDAATSEDASTPLTEVQLRLFEGIGPNFERALSRLLNAEQVLRVMGEAEAATRVRFEYEELKQALAAAVHDVHIRWSDEPRFQSVLERIGTELRRYRQVFSTNYDVLVYWACMRVVRAERRDVFKDGFFESGPAETVAFDITNSDVSRSAVHVLYPHGALHLVLTSEGETRKLVHREGASILDRFGDTLLTDAVPLVITEGSSEQKMASIRRADYLAHSLETLSDVRGNVVVFGHSLSPEDNHIVEALVKTRWDPRLIAVSIFPGGPDTQAEMQRIRGALMRPNIEVRFFDSTTHPLGAPDLSLRR
jgi:hypothetical protein